MKTLLVAFMAVMISGIGYVRAQEAAVPAAGEPAKVEEMKKEVKAEKKHAKKHKKAEKKVEEKKMVEEKTEVPPAPPAK